MVISNSYTFNMVCKTEVIIVDPPGDPRTISVPSGAYIVHVKIGEQVAKETQVMFIDNESKFGGKKEYFIDFIH